MLERSRYVTDEDVWISGNNSGMKFGMVHVIEENGFFGVGWSLCHEDDKFDKVEAKFIARGRAVNDLLENKRMFKDLVNCTSFEELGIRIPGSRVWVKKQDSKVFSCQELNSYTQEAFDGKLRLCINDIIWTCALEYLKSQETKAEN